MNRAEYLLTCLQEECSEATQASAKVLRFLADGRGPGAPLTNAEALVAELVDILAVTELLEKEGVIALPSMDSIHAMVLRKQTKLEAYMSVSRQMGTLNEQEAHRAA